MVTGTDMDIVMDTLILRPRLFAVTMETMPTKIDSGKLIGACLTVTQLLKVTRLHSRQVATPMSPKNLFLFQTCLGSKLAPRLATQSSTNRGICIFRNAVITSIS